jgi:hypothetical protein
MKRLALAVAVLSLAGSTVPAEAATPRTLRVLFVGNSLTYVNDLPAVVVGLGAASKLPDVELRMLAPGGWSIEDHWTIGEAPQVLASGRWDAVVLQQGPSALPESQVNLRTWAMRTGDDARKHGARPALYQVWPERHRFAVFPDVLASYRNAARASRSELFPAGDAWRAAWRRDPRLQLYGSDGFHPSRLGTYLAALVIYAGLVKSSPIGLPRVVPMPNGRYAVPAARARVLQQAAAEALRRR